MANLKKLKKSIKMFNAIISKQLTFAPFGSHNADQD